MKDLLVMIGETLVCIPPLIANLVAEFNLFLRSARETEPLATDRPTRSQIALARELGIAHPHRRSRLELSGELERARREMESPGACAGRAAGSVGVRSDARLREREFMEAEWDSVIARDPERMAAWFTCCVVRSFMCDHSDELDFAGPDFPAVRAIAARLAKVPAVMDSMRQYSPVDLRFLELPEFPGEPGEEPADGRLLAYRATTCLLATLYGIGDPNR